MNANELADYLLNFIMTVEDYDESKHEKAATMLRQQQAEIGALKDGLSSVYWHDTFVEVKKPNSDLIYRFKLDDVCNHGVDDGACKECYMKAQEK